jgi:hypothetical protein
MQIIKFTKDTEVEDRVYLAGQSHEFSNATAERLINSGVAADPEKMVAAPEKHPAAPVTRKAKK